MVVDPASMLAGAVAADEAHHAAGGHVDVHVLEIEALVVLFEVPYAE